MLLKQQNVTTTIKIITPLFIVTFILSHKKSEDKSDTKEILAIKLEGFIAAYEYTIYALRGTAYIGKTLSQAKKAITKANDCFLSIRYVSSRLGLSVKPSN